MKYSPDSDRSRLLFGAFATALLLVASCGGAHEEPEEQSNNAHNNPDNNAANNHDNNANNNHDNNNATNNSNNNHNNSSSNNAASNNAAPNSPNNATPCPTPNACGGCTELSGVPGESCGSCADGTLTCEGTEALRCEGQSPPNACGGCAVLEGAPDDPCGPCRRGVLACTGSDALTCLGDSTNACGGCTELSGAPGESCGSCGDGVLVCEGTDALICQGGAALNTCGGCSVLEGAPGEACGACEDGTLACEGLDALVCGGATATCQDESLHCDDATDNDGDGLTDCEDDQCDHHDACGDWSCVDVDLGSALGRPVSDAVGTEPDDRWDAECLHQGVNKVVFKWTAPRDGLYSFEIGGESGSSFVRLFGVRGDCATSQGLCVQRLNGEASNDGRYALPLRFEAGESILLVKEGSWKLSIAEQEIAAEFADVRHSISGGYTTGANLYTVTLEDSPFLINPEDYFSHWVRPVATVDGALTLLPWTSRLWFAAEVPHFVLLNHTDFDGDGSQDLYVAELWTVPDRPGSEQGHLYTQASQLNESIWTEVEPWRAPVVMRSDLTGDGVPDLVTWVRPAPSPAWALYSNSRYQPDDPTSAWHPDAQPVATLAVPPFTEYGNDSALSCDLNGDGQDDLILVTRGPEGLQAHLAYGPITSSADLEAAAVFPLPYIYPGPEHPLLATDLNHDGVCDLLLADTTAVHPETDKRTGAVHVFLGPLTSLALEDATWAMWGHEPREPTDRQSFGYAGSSMLLADLNQDGIEDLVVSNAALETAPTLEASIAQRGVVSILLGPISIGRQLTEHDLLIYEVYLREGIPGRSNFGLIMTAADLDQDGLPDLVVSNPSALLLYIFPGWQLNTLLPR